MTDILPLLGLGFTLWMLGAAMGLGSNKQLQRRTAGITARHGETPVKAEVGISIARTDPKGMFDLLANAILPKPEKLRARLARTGRNISMAQYLIGNAVMLVVGYFLARFLFHEKWLMVGCVTFLCGFFVPHMVIGNMIAKRSKAFITLFPDAIDLMVRGLRSGLPIGETIKAVGAEMEDPIGIEFRLVTDTVKLGSTLDKALNETARRLDIAEFKYFVISLAIQRETGGNLAETLDNLGDMLRKRKQMLLKVKAMSSEARASAAILGALPVVMFGLLMAVNRDYMMVFFQDPRGSTLLGFGFAMMVFGGWVMGRMAKFEI